MYRHFFKRFFDLVLSSAALLLLLPLLVAVAAWLYISSGGQGVFFTQQRPGREGRIFTIIKFRTMTNERDDDGELLPDSQRLSAVGRFLRKSSIDELPQLINVLRGDMSLVGPRPLMVSYLPLYSISQRRRHLLRPGITGWAQVNGRNNITWARKFELDVWYVDSCSFMLDLKIIFMTINKVLVREGVSEELPTPLEAFNGRN